MRRYIGQLAAVLLAVLLICPSAQADLMRGDSGDAVYDLQQLLFESGWLFELPDGIYGKRTEAAVKEFEEYAGLPADGIADDQMIYELAAALESLNDEMGVISGYFGKYVVSYFTGEPYDGNPEDDINDGGMEFSPYCIQLIAIDGSSHTDYCEEHHILHVETYRMLESGDPEMARAASDRWYEAVNDLYDEWFEITPVEKQGGIVANRATFLASVEAQRTAAGIGQQTDQMLVKAEIGISQMIRNQAAWLCGMIWEQKNSGLTSGEREEQAIVLNSAVIIEGDVIYYAGDIEGEGRGVYAMNSDGSGRRKLSDMAAALKAASNGNLLVWHYDDEGYGALEILRADGTTQVLEYTNCHAIADDGRFYYGGSSVAEDGSDHQWLLTSEPQYHEWFYPIDVVDGYLYFLDVNESSMVEYVEGGMLPAGDVQLNRLNLKTDNISVLSGTGTYYLGIEDGTAYYTREDFDVYDYESGGTFRIEVDEGLYSMNLDSVRETMISEIADDDLVFEYYMFVHDGIVYGEYSDYSMDEPQYRIIRRKPDGTKMPDLYLGDNDTAALCVEDNIFYGVQGTIMEYGDYFTYDESIVSYDLLTGVKNVFAMEENEALTFSEMRPRIVVNDGRIYYYVQDSTNGAQSLKSMALDGSDVITLAKSVPLY